MLHWKGLSVADGGGRACGRSRECVGSCSSLPGVGGRKVSDGIFEEGRYGLGEK